MGFWTIFGYFGQFLFFMRFFFQWIASEAKKKSVIPVSFWYFSICGSLILLIYAIHRKDQVFILGQAMGFLIYGRNLILIARHKKKEAMG